MAQIYLDHSATTFPEAELLDYFHEQLRTVSGNPASMHRLGQDAAKSIRDSRKTLAAILDCKPEEFVFTSGGTESINTAIKGYVAANPKRGRTIVTAAGEHAATKESLNHLAGMGYVIRTVPLGRDGRIDLEKLEQSIDDDTVMITCLFVHNETGVVQPIEEIVKIRDQKRPLAAIHLDAVQAIGKIPVHFSRLGVDLLSGSGHKFGSPKGIGFLVIRHGVRVLPLIHGGGQQKGLRSGTENAPLVAALTRAGLKSTGDLTFAKNYCSRLCNLLLDELDQRDVSYERLSPPDGVPQILNLSFPGLRGETLQHALELSHVFVSTGSACSSHKKGVSEVLLAMMVPQPVAECSIRISFSTTNTAEEMIITAQAIAQACQKYRR